MSATYSETFLKKYCRTNRIVCTRVSVNSERSLDFRTHIGQTLVVCEVKQIDMNDRCWQPSTPSHLPASMSQGASALVFGKEVTLQTHGKDKYGRTLGDVFLLDGTNLNQELVKQGWWWYRKYAPGDTVLEGLEKDARETRKELWADPQSVPPWEWQKMKRLSQKGNSRRQGNRQRGVKS